MEEHAVTEEQAVEELDFSRPIGLPAVTDLEHVDLPPPGPA
jgi:hypothetical protein